MNDVTLRYDYVNLFYRIVSTALPARELAHCCVPGVLGRCRVEFPKVVVENIKRCGCKFHPIFSSERILKIG